MCFSTKKNVIYYSHTWVPFHTNWGPKHVWIDTDTDIYSFLYLFTTRDIWFLFCEAGENCAPHYKRYVVLLWLLWLVYNFHTTRPKIRACDLLSQGDENAGVLRILAGGFFWSARKCVSPALMHTLGIFSRTSFVCVISRAAHLSLFYFEIVFPLLSES